MSLWICTTCTCAFSVGAPRCPQCGGHDYRDEHEPENTMPKTTRDAGASFAGHVNVTDPGTNRGPEWIHEDVAEDAGLLDASDRIVTLDTQGHVTHAPDPELRDAQRKAARDIEAEAAEDDEDSADGSEGEVTKTTRNDQPDPDAAEGSPKSRRPGADAKPSDKGVK